MNEFEELFNINVNNHTENKNGLTYLSWAWAWAEVMKRYPNAYYSIERFGEDNKPYLYDSNMGYMVFTRVSINGTEREMWLPVMDSNNKTMLDHPYTYDTKYKKDIPVVAATMFDINKTIMRCLVKNLAMFGLGLYIYSGEDLPEGEKYASKEQIKELQELVDKESWEDVLVYCKASSWEEIPVEKAKAIIEQKKKAKETKKGKKNESVNGKEN